MRGHSHYLLVISLIFLCQSVNAGAIYHCIDQHGKKAFQDRPCALGSNEVHSNQKHSKPEPHQSTGQQRLQEAIVRKAPPEEILQAIRKDINQITKDSAAQDIFFISRVMEVAEQNCPPKYRSELQSFKQRYATEIKLGEQHYYKNISSRRTRAMLTSRIEDMHNSRKKLLKEKGIGAFCRWSVHELNEFKEHLYLH